MKEKSLSLVETKRADIRSISEVYFGYNAEMEGYTNLSSDIPELSEIPHAALESFKSLE